MYERIASVQILFCPASVLLDRRNGSGRVRSDLQLQLGWNATNLGASTSVHAHRRLRIVLNRACDPREIQTQCHEQPTFDEAEETWQFDAPMDTITRAGPLGTRLRDRHPLICTPPTPPPN